MTDQPEKYSGESRDGRFSDQQHLIWNRLKDGVADITQANAALASRASAILTASTGLFAVSSLFVSIPEEASIVIRVLAGLCGLALAAIATLSATVWIPQDSSVAGSSDVMLLYQEYIDEDIDNCYLKALTDMSSVFDEERERNAFLAEQIKKLSYVLDAQVVLLVVMIMVGYTG